MILTISFDAKSLISYYNLFIISVFLLNQESKNYSYSYPHVQESTSSFTQLVWRGSRFLGMGCALRKGLLANDVFVVALYSPPGNVGDGVTANVLRPESEGTKPDVYSNIFRKSKIGPEGSEACREDCQENASLVPLGGPNGGGGIEEGPRGL